MALGALAIVGLVGTVYFASTRSHDGMVVSKVNSEQPVELIKPAPSVATPAKQTPESLPISPLASSDPSLVAFVTTPVDAKDQATRIQPDFTAQVTTLSTKAEFDAVVTVLRNKDDEDTARNEAANLLRRTHYERLDDELLALLDRVDESPRMRFFFVQHLGNGLEKSSKDRAHVIETRLQRALTDRDVMVRRESLRILAMHGNEEAEKLVSVALQNARQNGWRDLIIRLSLDLGQERREEIRGCLTDSDEKVRITAIAALGILRDGESRGKLESIAKAKTTSVRERRAAETALVQLQVGGF